jgi:hypothetical protein
MGAHIFSLHPEEKTAMKTNPFRFLIVLLMLTTISLFSGLILANTSLRMDIKPGSCPNPLNLNSKGILTVAVLGNDVYDVTHIDLASLVLSRADGDGGSVAALDGPPGPGSNLEDVGAQFGGEACDCSTSDPDGILDLVVKFRTDEVVEALELYSLSPGSGAQLVLTGTLLDGTPFALSDCVVVIFQLD